MQHPLDMGAHYYPPEAHPDHRSHRYRSFMIEEILTDHPERKVSTPAGELLKFGVQALLSARPFHSHLGKTLRTYGWYLSLGFIETQLEVEHRLGQHIFISEMYSLLINKRCTQTINPLRKTDVDFRF